MDDSALPLPPDLSVVLWSPPGLNVCITHLKHEENSDVWRFGSCASTFLEVPAGRYTVQFQANDTSGRFVAAGWTASDLQLQPGHVYAVCVAANAAPTPDGRVAVGRGTLVDMVECTRDHSAIADDDMDTYERKKALRELCATIDAQNMRAELASSLAV